MKKYISIMVMLLLCTVVNAFEGSKYYTINRNGNSSAYAYANSEGSMGCGSLSAGDANYIWQLIPTSTTNGYYIKNVGTGQYAQSSKITLSSNIQMGDSPVEYIISTGAGSSTYFLASNDQDGIDYSQDATLGFNFGASGVVAFYIKTGRGNSYWTISETSYTPATDPAEKAPYSALSVTFNRTGTDASSVSCTVVDGDGSTIEGASATVSCNQSFKATGNAVTDAILCPNVNGNTSPTITLGITITGLHSAFAFDRAALDIHALNGGGSYQESADGIVRQWNVAMTEDNSAFASLTDIDIAAGVTEHHKAWELAGNTVSVGDDGSLSITLTITKGTTNSGCFFGLSSLSLSTDTTEPSEPGETVVHTFSADKFYHIKWFSGQTNFLTEVVGGKLQVASQSNVQKQVWKLIPTEKSNCYYIQNAISDKYVQSCNLSNSNQSLVGVGFDPVEYYISLGSDGTASAYRLTSTDCPDYADTSKSPHGLNKDGAGNNIIVWQAGAANTGSYWVLSETAFDRTAYDEAQEALKVDPCPSIAVITLPCATLSKDTYLSQISIQGSGAQTALNYAPGSPTTVYNLYTKKRATLVRSREATLTASLVGKSVSGLSVTLYADLDGDGVFEHNQSAEELTDELQFTIMVPAETTSTQGRLRLVVDQSGSNTPDEAYGTIYDLPVNILSLGDLNADARIDITDAAILVDDLNNGRTPAAADLNGDTKVDVEDAKLLKNEILK